MKKLLALLLLVAVPAFGAEVAGVKIDDQIKAGNAELVLNGAGVRKLVFFNVYAMGLYLPKKTSVAAEAIAGEGRKRVALHMLRDVGAERFTSALVEGIRENHTEAQAKALEPRIRELTAIMAEVKKPRRAWPSTSTGTARNPGRHRWQADRQTHRRRRFLPGAAAHLARRQAGAGRPEEGAARRLAVGACSSAILRSPSLPNARRHGFPWARFSWPASWSI
jgi:hypothetical protein